MAVKAVAQITSFDMDNAGMINIYLRIMNYGNVSNNVQSGPYDPGSSDVTIDTDLKAFVKQYCIDTWSEVFGMLDTVRILFKLNSLV
jgi:hypothetical protein